jgi:20S proteasome alpha/beta subunit
MNNTTFDPTEIVAKILKTVNESGLSLEDQKKVIQELIHKLKKRIETSTTPIERPIITKEDFVKLMEEYERGDK